MKEIGLEAKCKQTKMVYNRLTNTDAVNLAENYLQVPYKNHYIVEMWGVDAEILSYKQNLGEKIDEVVNKLNLHALTKFTHQFVPHGVTGFVIIEESHLAVHTWPEYKYLHLDLVTCHEGGIKNMQPVLSKVFNPGYMDITELKY